MIMKSDNKNITLLKNSSDSETITLALHLRLKRFKYLLERNSYHRTLSESTALLYFIP